MGTKAACAALGRSRQTHYRLHRKSPPPPRPERVPARQPRALSDVERKEVLAVLHSDEHVDEATATVYTKLLDDGIYLASTSTMYRSLGRQRRGSGAAPSGVAPASQEARTGGDQAQRRLLVGHHQAVWPRKMDLLLPVCAISECRALRSRPHQSPVDCSE